MCPTICVAAAASSDNISWYVAAAASWLDLFFYRLCVDVTASVCLTIYVVAAPLICNYYYVLYGILLRFRARNRYYLINILIIIVFKQVCHAIKTAA